MAANMQRPLYIFLGTSKQQGNFFDGHSLGVPFAHQIDRVMRVYPIQRAAAFTIASAAPHFGRG
ncbi:MAG: hypothetical protein ACI4JF_07890 [Oscillospiraceae bacterium]